MAEQPIEITDADHQSFDAKWQSFVDSLTPAETALLEARLAGEGDDVQGYWIDPRPYPKSSAARPRPGSSAQPPR